MFTPWQYFVQLTWSFFVMAMIIRIASWTLSASLFWLNVGLGGSPDGPENDN